MLKNKNILLGVCGSIASYKSAEIVRLLVKAGANVKVVMTKEATSFITPLTLSTLSKNQVYAAYYSETGEWHNHVALALWADLILIAPATANTLAKFATGLCDNLLTAVYLSAKCPVYVAPAMDLDMWKHPATQNNVEQLKTHQIKVISPAAGELASGLEGEGRLPEPFTLIQIINAEFEDYLPLRGKKVLVTAGPTYEAIDPVRFIGNHSSGKMGYAIAKEMKSRGAQVTLVSGPTALTPAEGIELVHITSAEDLLGVCLSQFKDVDICVMSAAVADYTPTAIAKEKLKKDSDHFNIDLKKTTDILYTLGQQKNRQLLIGFALETQNEEENAIGKLKRKNLDLIVLNSLRDEGAGFKNDTNKITIIDKALNKTEFTLKSKEAVAKDICDKITSLL